MGLSQYDPPIEVSFVRETSNDLEDLINILPDETLENNRWSRMYEQILGISIHYDWTAQGDLYSQKQSFSVSSGQLPDITRVSAEQLRILSNAGLIQELTDAYKDYATPLTKEILEQEGHAPFDTATIDGKLMAIPETTSSIEGAMYIWLRTDWMEQLNLQPPQTIDDVLEISRAFTLMDPDQNGLNDTLGLAITNYLWDPIMGIKGFMAGYEAYPEIWIADEEGNLVFGGIQPEVKTALETLQQMYKNGQLDSEFSFKNGEKVKQQIASGNIGMVYGEQWGSFLVQESQKLNANADWKAYPIVALSDELPKVPLKLNTWQYFVVRKEFAQPEAIIKLINLHLEKNWGGTGEFETFYSSPHPVWKLSPVTPYPAKKNFEAYQQLEAARRTGNWTELNAEAQSIQKLIKKYQSGGEDKEHGWGWEKTYGTDGAFSILDQYEQNNQLLYEAFTGAPTETMIERKSLLHDLQHEAYINIILGNSIDEFDQFVDTWHELGGAKITKEVNEWYKLNK
ncbi:ABC transporter substrate-binding protein [Paenibacillus crassostreae]|uniref:ABC transporter substrate-binding protein n=1 Tax=Paenibacillus crassostreae TaxID=1763538 RepID=A0A167GFB7_9BACL|nr:ABC transporter substrate-binding protein [Paenibacillus crassostreae]OAB77522.1 ABC transporter substrate-binding protein [Paenibacillus crassostreae]